MKKHELERPHHHHPHHPKHHPLHHLMKSFWDDDMSFFGNHSMVGEDRKGNLSLSEDESHVYVEANLAGLQENEIDVTLDKGVLWIRGEKEEVKDERKYHHKAYRSYSYKLALPESANTDSEPRAKYEKGILSITFDKVDGQTARKIKFTTDN